MRLDWHKDGCGRDQALTHRRAASIIHGTMLTGAPRSINSFAEMVWSMIPTLFRMNTTEIKRGHHEGIVREPVHNRSLEFVSCPKLHVVDVASWRGRLQELTGVKYSVVSLKIRVAVNLPLDLDAGPISDEPASARPSRN